ncbi:MAG: hypothetical protein AAFR16_08495 [Pseudomonadota bacterium]
MSETATRPMTPGERVQAAINRAVTDALSRASAEIDRRLRAATEEATAEARAAADEARASAAAAVAEVRQELEAGFESFDTLGGDAALLALPAPAPAVPAEVEDTQARRSVETLRAQVAQLEAKLAALAPSGVQLERTPLPPLSLCCETPGVTAMDDETADLVGAAAVRLFFTAPHQSPDVAHAHISPGEVDSINSELSDKGAPILPMGGSRAAPAADLECLALAFAKLVRDFYANRTE